MPSFDTTTRRAMVEDQHTTLLVLRHGAVDTGDRRRCYGHLDLPLSPLGEAQGAALLRWVLDEPERPAKIWSSDLARCAGLAQEIHRAIGAPLELSPAWREQHMGQWEGAAWEDLQREHGRAINDAWACYEGWAPPGGESFADLCRRLAPLVLGPESRIRGGRHLLVGHAGVVRAISCLALGLPPSQGLRLAVAPGTWSRFLLAEAGGVVEVLGAHPKVPSRPQPRGRPPRIALSGSAGVGKTTLARALARRWAVPYVPEGMRERLEGGLDLHGLDHAGIAELVIELWREQRAREAQAITTSGGFVADRSAIDFFAYWVLYRLDGDPERTAAFHGELLAHTRGYDQVLVLPWGALPLQDDGVRSPNGWNQLHLQATLEGLVRRFLPEEQVLWLPPAVQELRDRERWVQARVGTGPA